MNDQTPLVSVLLPVYNGEKTLLKAINSVLNQTHTNVEFLIADDCSTNRTRSVLSSNSI